MSQSGPGGRIVHSPFPTIPHRTIAHFCGEFPISVTPLHQLPGPPLAPATKTILPHHTFIHTIPRY